MDLGAFSLSLTVQDLAASRAFYEKLGFEVVGGNADENWLILRNSGHTIGLFKGMFDRNIISFNPGWDDESNEVEEFTDVRELQRQLKAQGIGFVREADESTSGPEHFIVHDPDGNPIMVDQFV
jgi:catechol 2,3-dioxygenase-like lactoylglutathione lyase family enzyme